MISGIETHENGARNIEIDENTVAEDELSKNTVPNDHVQDFNVPLDTSSLAEESLINSHNMMDEDNPQIKSSRELMKKMVANRRNKKLIKKISVDSVKNLPMDHTLISVREYLIAWREILLRKP